MTIYFCPRLVDYVAIVGNRTNNHGQPPTDSTIQVPELLRRYPPEDHRDFPLPPDIVYFCQPEGCSFVKAKRSAVRETNTFVFTLTEKDANRVRYGVVVNFYRPVEIRRGPHSSHASPSPGPDSSIESGACLAGMSSRPKRPHPLSSLTSLCLLSHHPFFPTFRECLYILKNLIDASSEKNFIRKSPTSRHTRKDWVWTLLTSRIPESLSISSSILSDVKEIETWIFRLLSAPVPVPGRTKVELQVLPTDMRPPFTLALPDQTRLSLVDFPLHLPLELLGVEASLKVLTSILLEQKVVIQSRDYNALSMSVMAFVAMIYPLEYMFPVIPLLPSCMSSAEQLLLAPTPYIIGVPASFLRYKKNFRLPDDVWLVDLDANRIVKPPACEELPQLPEPDGSILKNHLKQALTSMSQQPVKTLESVVDTNVRQPKHPPSATTFNPFVYGNDVDSVDIATRVAIIRFLNSGSVLANFLEHTRTIRLYPRPVVAFQVDSFLQSRPKCSPFLSKLVRSQAVEFLAEWSLCPTNLAFLRIQTGVFDPSIVGDKAKWFSHQLDAITFTTWSDGTAAIASQSFSYLSMSGIDARYGGGGDVDTDEDSSDSDGDEDDFSSSSSYSSLSDYVTEMVRSEISDFMVSAADPNEAASAHVIANVGSVYHPPSSLQLSSLPLDRRLSSIMDEDVVHQPDDNPDDDDSSPTHSSPSDDDGSSLNDEEERLFPEEEGSEDTPQPSSLPTTMSTVVLPHPHRSSSTTSSDSQMGGVRPPILPPPSPARKLLSSASDRLGSSEGSTTSGHRPLSAEPSLDSAKNPQVAAVQAAAGVSSGSGRSSPTPMSRTASIVSAFSRSGSVGGGQVGGGHSSSGDSVSSFLDRFTSEAKEVAREAKAAAAEASKAALEAAKKDQRTQKLLADIRTNMEPVKTQAKELWRLSQESRESQDLSTTPPTLSSIPPAMRGSEGRSSIVSGDFNGLADKTSSMISGLFGPGAASKAASIAEKVKEKTEQLAQQHSIPSSMTRKGLVEKTSLIRHSATRKGSEVFGQGDLKSNHFENQQFLKEMTDQVLAGDGIGWLKLGRVKKLMEDENYRNLVVSRLNKSLESKVSPDDHIEDVQVSKAVYKGMVKILNAVVSGLESSVNRKGAGGMASAMLALELAHTHYYSKEPEETLEGNPSSAASTASPSQVTSPFGSRENLHRLSGETPSAVLQPTTDSSTTDEIVETPGGTQLPVNPGISVNICQSGSDGEVADIDATGYNFSAARLSCRSTHSDSELDAIQGRQTRTSSVWSNKSSVSTGYRYHGGSLMTGGGPGTTGFPVDPPRIYVFQGMVGKDRSKLWDIMQFWEDAYLDAVSIEREVVGLDQGPAEMMERYRSLSDVDRRRLEIEEDRLLATLLYNVVAFMVMMNVPREEGKKKVRRLLGKCHIGLIYSAEINGLLDQLENLHGNDIDLKPLTSRQMHRQTFSCHLGTDATGEMVFMEVRDDGLIIRSINGTIIERWWYERLVNMTYSPKNKVLGLWRRTGGQTNLHKYYTKKSKDLYHCIKEAMGRAAARGAAATPGSELGGEFPVQDMKTGEGGLLQVCMEGVGLLFANSKDFEFFVRLENIRKCFTQKGGIFVLEEFNPKTRQIVQRKYKSQLADQICYAVLCVFSYIAAGLEQKKKNSRPRGSLIDQSASPQPTAAKVLGPSLRGPVDNVQSTPSPARPPSYIP